MISVVDAVSLISSTMDNLIDFIATDEFLGNQFEQYLEKNQIEIEDDFKLNNILIEYLLSQKIETGQYVIDYYKEKTNSKNDEVLNSLKNSFQSVFQINQILKNSYTVYDLAGENKLTLISLSKTAFLKGIGRFDYILSRVINFQNVLYMLEINEVFSDFREFEANCTVVSALMQNPKIAVLNNREKLLNIKKSISSFNSSFLECFNKKEFVVSSKSADRILDEFYKFHLGEINSIEYTTLSDDFKYAYFEVEKYTNNIIKNLEENFNSSNKEYDIGFYSDEKYGFFMIPFLGTFNKILESGNLDSIENSTECIKNFILDDKIPPVILKEKEEKYKTLLKLINETFNKNFNSMDEVISLYKDSYSDGLRFSPISVLYESKGLEKIMNKKAIVNEFEKVGRNDPCPCGSGKKYKKCCLNKGEQNG